MFFSPPAVYLLFAGVLLAAPIVSGQAPVICAENATLARSGVCCPVDPVSGVQCTGRHRGSCRKLEVYRYPYPEYAEMDDRIHWPTRMFQYTCHCEPNYFGAACEECNYGFTGPDCKQRRTLIRRDIRSYSAEEKRRLVDILARSNTYPSGFMVLYEKDRLLSDPVKDPVWIPASIRYYLVAMHRYASRSTMHNDPRNCSIATDHNHNTLAFLTWHRYYMMLWERFLGRIALEVYGQEDFAFPFWDWIGRDRCEVCTNDLMGAPGKQDQWGQRLDVGSPFYNWTEYCSTPAQHEFIGHCYACHTASVFRKLVRQWINTEYPTKDDLDFVFSLTDYFNPNEKKHEDIVCKSFHRGVEGFCSKPNGENNHLYMHNRMHNLVHGSFCCSATAANDPLFGLHHAQVDRMLERWMQIHNAGPLSLPTESLEFGACRNCTMMAFFPQIRHRDVMHNSLQLGYTFEHFNFGEDYDTEGGD